MLLLTGYKVVVNVKVLKSRSTGGYKSYNTENGDDKIKMSADGTWAEGSRREKGTSTGTLVDTGKSFGTGFQLADLTFSQMWQPSAFTLVITEAWTVTKFGKDKYGRKDKSQEVLSPCCRGLHRALQSVVQFAQHALP